MNNLYFGFASVTLLVGHIAAQTNLPTNLPTTRVPIYSVKLTPGNVFTVAPRNVTVTVEPGVSQLSRSNESDFSRAYTFPKTDGISVTQYVQRVTDTLNGMWTAPDASAEVYTVDAVKVLYANLQAQLQKQVDTLNTQLKTLSDANDALTKRLNAAEAKLNNQGGPK